MNMKETQGACEVTRTTRKAGPRTSLGTLSPKGSGFTLVELLVVVAIVAILAALLLAGTRRFQESSNASKCVSNLRQLYTAANLWSADNDGWMLPTFPSGRNADNRINVSWATALFPYLSPGVNLWSASDVGKRPKGCLACPSSKFLVPPVNTGGCSDYAKNAVVNVSQTSSYGLKKSGGMDNMSKVIFLADSDGGRDLSPFVTNGNIVNRHNGNANVLFYDGHAEALKSSDTNQIPRGASAVSNPPWQP